MRRGSSIAVLLLVGVGLMFNPVYLPIAADEPTEGYVHTVEPVGSGVPAYDDADVVPYDELSTEGQVAFDRALANAENTHVVDDPTDRVSEFAYPPQPELGTGLTIVAAGGTEYALWTYTIERESRLVVAQRVVVQPGLFLLGFFAILGAAALAWKAQKGTRVDGAGRPPTR